LEGSRKRNIWAQLGLTLTHFGGQAVTSCQRQKPKVAKNNRDILVINQWPGVRDVSHPKSECGSIAPSNRNNRTRVSGRCQFPPLPPAACRWRLQTRSWTYAVCRPNAAL